MILKKKKKCTKNVEIDSAVLMIMTAVKKTRHVDIMSLSGTNLKKCKQKVRIRHNINKWNKIFEYIYS